MQTNFGVIVRRPTSRLPLTPALALRAGGPDDSDQVTVAYRRNGSGLCRTFTLDGRAHEHRIGTVLQVDETHEGWDSLILQGFQPEGVEGTPKFNLRYADLFSGCGGMSLGLEQAAQAVGGIAASALAIDSNPSVLDIYGYNIACEHLIRGDITEQSLPTSSTLGNIDLLIGGPPCQGHSNLNNHTRRDDQRNNLYFEMVRFALDYEVPVVVIENVPTVLRSKNSVVDQSAAVLKLGGYKVQSVPINALLVGVPQTRKRHFLVASRNEMPPMADFINAFRTDERSVGWAIGDLLDANPARRIDVPANLANVNRARIKEMFENDLYEMPMHLRPPSHQFGRYSYTSVYGRLHWDRPAGTITTNFRTPGCGRFIHPWRERTLTMHEAARLQTFPDTFEFFPPGVQLSNQTVQTAIGNAVPPKLAFVVGLWAIAALGITKADAVKSKQSDNGYHPIEPKFEHETSVTKVRIPA